MTNENSAGASFENLKSLEAELFKVKRGGKSAPAPRRPESPAPSQDTWKLNQEVLDARREIAALREELNAARVVITEQNVLTASSRSALKELQQDLDLAAAKLGERQSGLSEMSEELSRLSSEALIEKRRSAEFKKKLEQEAALREELQALLGEAAQREEELHSKLQAIEASLRARPVVGQAEPRPDRPARFIRRYF